MRKDKNKAGERAADRELEKYRDPGGVSVKEMNFALWWVKNRPRITKGVIGVLIALIAFFFIYSAYHFALYFSQSQEANNLFSSENNLFTQRQVVTDLTVAQPVVFANGGKDDLAVLLINPNDKFTGYFSYCFLNGDVKMACGQSFILPGDKKYILALGQSLTTTQGWQLQLDDVSWQRLDVHQIPDWEQFVSYRLHFTIADLSFTGAGSEATAVSLNTVAFNITNNSPFSYYEVPLNILLYNGSQLVGVNRYNLENFLAGDKRAVKITWAGHLRAVSNVEVVPDVNITDTKVFLPYQGESDN